VRVRGLKYLSHEEAVTLSKVVPRAGTWIEIASHRHLPANHNVVPRAGTWIEILRGTGRFVYLRVVPRAGTWIEMSIREVLSIKGPRRTPCGYVD